MNFNLTTQDIQKMIIALIMSMTDDDCFTNDDRDRFLNKLTDMNNLCDEDNNYTLHITVND